MTQETRQNSDDMLDEGLFASFRLVFHRLEVDENIVNNFMNFHFKARVILDCIGKFGKN